MPRVIFGIVKVLLRVCVFLALLAGPVSPGQSSLLGIASEELERNFRILKEKTDPPPYFLAYEITENESSQIGATLGAITSSGSGKSRVLDTSVRVGTPKLDNYHRVRGERAQFTSGSQIAIDDNPAAIQRRDSARDLSACAQRRAAHC